MNVSLNAAIGIRSVSDAIATNRVNSTARRLKSARSPFPYISAIAAQLDVPMPWSCVCAIEASLWVKKNVITSRGLKNKAMRMLSDKSPIMPLS